MVKKWLRLLGWIDAVVMGWLLSNPGQVDLSGSGIRPDRFDVMLRTPYF
jgi:hypothetical protein